MGGAGGSLRAGVTRNPVRLTRSVQAGRTRVTCGGAPAYVWPGGGITLMVDVTRMPDRAFGYVPTPALVAPLEFTTARAPNTARSAATTRRSGRSRTCCAMAANTAPICAPSARSATRMAGPQVAFLPDGRRLHLHHGPIDLIVDAEGPGRAAALRAAVARFDTILQELVDELPELRRPLRARHRFRGAVARAMADAVRPHGGVFVTPMAAVAGAVADEVLAA